MQSKGRLWAALFFGGFWGHPDQLLEEGESGFAPSGLPANRRLAHEESQSPIKRTGSAMSDQESKGHFMIHR